MFVLLDVEGTLHLSGVPFPGAVEAVARLRRDGHHIRLVTNVTTRPRARLAAELRGIGFAVEESELHTTPVAAADLLAGRHVLALAMPAVREDLAARVTLVDEGADAVLVGGADETDESDRVFTYANLDRAFRELHAGARLVCLHRNRWWPTRRGPRLDGGAFVAALEYATGATAEVVGKPSRAFFESALATVGAEADDAVMVGDDLETDVAGARAVGMRAVLVRTGKSRDEVQRGVLPDAVLESVADLPEWLAAHE